MCVCVCVCWDRSELEYNTKEILLVSLLNILSQYYCICDCPLRKVTLSETGHPLEYQQPLTLPQGQPETSRVFLSCLESMFTQRWPFG